MSAVVDFREGRVSRGECPAFVVAAPHDAPAVNSSAHVHQKQLVALLSFSLSLN